LKLHWKVVLPGLVLGTTMVGIAPVAQANNYPDCGPLAKGEVYVVSGRDVNCQQARYVMNAYIDGNPTAWTCGGPARFPGAWCTSPPDARVELR
jgi:hypothetical protein